LRDDGELRVIKALRHLFKISWTANRQARHPQQLNHQFPIFD
jgi:hypothetical protein